MPNTPNQKLKQLYLMKILLEQTDEEHTLSINDLIDQLRLYGITAERKSLYADIERLKEFNINVESRKTNTVTYYVKNRTFSLAELKLMVDAVQSSRFIPVNDSTALIKKIVNLGSIHHAKQLNRQVFVEGHPKAINEDIFINVDTIHMAINERRKINFKYFDYNAKKLRVYRKHGQFYVQSPISLCWKEDNYYLIAFSAEHKEFRHYRVDRMSDISMLDEPYDDIGSEKFDVATYTKKVFGMYSGEIVCATLSFDPSLLNVVFDRFGRDIYVKEEANGWVTITVEVSTSPVFLGWLIKFGCRAKIIAPTSLLEAMQTLISDAVKNYCI